MRNTGLAYRPCLTTSRLQVNVLKVAFLEVFYASAELKINCPSINTTTNNPPINIKQHSFRTFHSYFALFLFLIDLFWRCALAPFQSTDHKMNVTAATATCRKILTTLFIMFSVPNKYVLILQFTNSTYYHISNYGKSLKYHSLFSPSSEPTSQWLITKL